MRSRIACSAILAAGVCLHTGCAGRTRGLTSRFLLHPEAKQVRVQPPDVPEPSLEEAMGKLRHLMAEARPAPKGDPTPTLEMRDPELKAARANLEAAKTAPNYLDVGRAYYRHGLLNKAYEHYAGALRLNPRSWEAYDGMARIWRDWRRPDLALPDAQRAVYFDPKSAAAENTRGTILQALGLRKEARAAYDLARRLDPAAAYALSNLCYLSFVEGNAALAISECQAALWIDPDLPAAHNNLGLTYAAAGRLDLAGLEFGRAGGPATAAYNLGVVHLARKEYDEAADQFAAAHETDPSLMDADRRAINARRLAATEPAGSGKDQQ
jgi:tetratricopeptide (TPR) repeat protein